MLPGETLLSVDENKLAGECMDCGAELPFRVCQSAAGYYIGTWCNHCGPYSRESNYFRTQKEAELILASWQDNGPGACRRR